LTFNHSHKCLPTVHSTESIIDELPEVGDDRLFFIGCGIMRKNTSQSSNENPISDSLIELRAKLKASDPEVQNFVAALEVENLKLQKKIASLQVENVSAHNRIKALEQQKDPHGLKGLSDEELTQRLEKLIAEAGYVRANTT
jgi:hypothetical protein